MISSDHLAPGAVGQIKATVSTVNRSGRLSKHISIYSNDRVTPVVTVELTMDVVLDTAVPKEAAPKGVVPK